MAHKKLSLMKRAAVMAVLALGLASTGVYAYTVSFDTSAISGRDYYLEFQLTNGDGVNNSTINLTGLDLGGGISNSSATELTGGVSGNLANLVLTDTEFYNDLLWGFKAGSSVSFNFDFTYGGSNSPAPDQFSFFILNTDDFTQVDAMSYSVESSAAPVPEPSTLLLLTGGLAGGLLARRRRKS